MRAPRLSTGQQRMVALGLQPALIDELTAAAMCGMTAKRFRAECPLPGARIGKGRFWPRTEIEAWARSHWAKQCGHDTDESNQSADASHWASLLPEPSRGEGSKQKGKKREAVH